MLVLFYMSHIYNKNENIRDDKRQFTRKQIKKMSAVTRVRTGRQAAVHSPGRVRGPCGRPGGLRDTPGARGSRIRRGAGADFRPRAPRHRHPNPASQPGPPGRRARQWPSLRPLRPAEGAATRPSPQQSPPGPHDGLGRSQRERGRRGLAATVRARCPRALPRERACRGSHGAAGASGRHSVRQRLPPAARAARARRGGAACARVRRPGRGLIRALGAHLRRYGGRGACRRRLPGLLQERPQPLRHHLHGLPHATPRPHPSARLPDSEECPPRSRTQSGFLVSAPEVRTDPAGPGAPAPGAGRPQQREATTSVNSILPVRLGVATGCP